MTNERVDDSDISMAQHGRQDVEDPSGLYGGLKRGMVQYETFSQGGFLEQPTGDLIYNKRGRSFKNGRMVHQCDRLVVDLFVMKAG